ncbi:LOW QUALITY PROTEIN: coiled-coil domain-containing protein 121 [Mus pahari]|uniref:LOW QUALITY PROTEIN: coiled-coil domain-containing protein 121 n=1 Tax=Mus pahari TaxID=10093 RepID=UPI000A309DCC|nr:LOW QUALITY PROTEIN: coiled-coil domain-containing protein 121 [Mus pahari]
MGRLGNGEGVWGPEKESAVAELGIGGGARPCSSEVREETNSQMQCNCISQDRSPRSGGKSSRPATTNLVAETKKLYDVNPSCAKSHPVCPKVKTPLENCVPRRHTCGTSSLAKPLSEQQTHFHACLNSGTRFAQSSKGSPQPSTYLTILNELFKSERLTELENKVKNKTIEALESLNRKIEGARLKQERLLQDSRLLQRDTLCVGAEKNCLLRVLRKQSEQCKQKHWQLWSQRVQQWGEIMQRKQELTLRFAKQTEELQTQLFQGKIKQFQLEQQFQSMEHISSTQKSQQMKIQMLEKELEDVKAETARKDHQAQVQFLQRKTHLIRQIQGLRSLQAGDHNTPEVRQKAQLFKSTAKKVNLEFCLSVCRENQELQEDLVKLIQEYHKLESIKRKLEMCKKWLKEERWYQEALVRGRGQLKAKRERSHTCDPCPPNQDVLRPH